MGHPRPLFRLHLIFLVNLLKKIFAGCCGSDGRAVTSDTSGRGFEFIHQHQFLPRIFIYCCLLKKHKKKEKGRSLGLTLQPLSVFQRSKMFQNHLQAFSLCFSRTICLGFASKLLCVCVAFVLHLFNRLNTAKCIFYTKLFFPAKDNFGRRRSRQFGEGIV